MPSPTEIKSCCVSGHIHSGTPKGTESTVYGLPAYVALPEDKDKAKTAIFLTDIFGYKLVNARLLADEWASNGYHVIVPDIFSGDWISDEYLNVIVPNLREQERKGIAEKAADSVTMMAQYGPWAAKHRDAVTQPIIEDFMNKAKADVDLKQIVAVGFCFGGRHAILLGGGDSVDAVVAFHPSGVSVPSELTPLKKPTLISIGDADAMMSMSQVDEAKKTFDEMKDKNGSKGLEVIVYPKAVHGFSVRGDDETAEEKELKVKGMKDALAFLDKYL